MYMLENTCCFFGHRTINETKELKSKLNEIIEKLIVDENVNTFLLPSGNLKKTAAIIYLLLILLFSRHRKRILHNLHRASYHQATIFS